MRISAKVLLPVLVLASHLSFANVIKISDGLTVTGPIRPTISNNGKYVYMGGFIGDGGVVRYDVATGHILQVGSCDKFNGCGRGVLDSSADGKTVAYSNDQNLVIQNLSARTSETLEGFESGRLSPNARYVAQRDTRNGGVMVRDLKKSQTFSLKGEYGFYTNYPAFSNDSRYLTYNEQRAGKDFENNIHVRVYDFKTNRLMKKSFDIGMKVYTVWECNPLNSASELLCQVGAKSRGVLAVLVNMQSGKWDLVAENFINVGLSPNHQDVYLTWRTEGKKFVTRKNLHSGQETEIYRDSSSDSNDFYLFPNASVSSGENVVFTGTDGAVYLLQNK